MSQATSWGEESQADEMAWGKSKEDKELGVYEEKRQCMCKQKANARAAEERRWEGQVGPLSDELYWEAF